MVEAGDTIKEREPMLLVFLVVASGLDIDINDTGFPEEHGGRFFKYFSDVRNALINPSAPEPHPLPEWVWTLAADVTSHTYKQVRKACYKYSVGVIKGVRAFNCVISLQQ